MCSAESCAIYAVEIEYLNGKWQTVSRLRSPDTTRQFQDLGTQRNESKRNEQQITAQQQQQTIKSTLNVTRKSEINNKTLLKTNHDRQFIHTTSSSSFLILRLY